MTITIFLTFAAICVIALVADAIHSQPIRKTLFWIIGTFLVLICGFREIGIDQDSVGYYLYFNLDDYGMSQVAEPTFRWIASLARVISSDNGLTVLFLIYAIIGVSAKLYAIETIADQKWLALITYFSSYFLLHEFTQIRAGIACGLILISIKFIYERKLVEFLLTIACASFFHYSSLVAFSLYFLPISRPSAVMRLLIALSIPLGIVFNFAQFEFVRFIPIELVRSKIQTYIDLENSRDIKLNAFNAVYLVKFFLLYVFLYNSDRISRSSKYFPIMLQMFAISMFCYLSLSFNATFAIRISEMFGIVEIVLIPLLVYVFRHRILGVAAVLTIAIGNLALGIFQTELIQQLP